MFKQSLKAFLKRLRNFYFLDLNSIKLEKTSSQFNLGLFIEIWPVSIEVQTALTTLNDDFEKTLQTIILCACVYILKGFEFFHKIIKKLILLSLKLKCSRKLKDKLFMIRLVNIMLQMTSY